MIPIEDKLPIETINYRNFSFPIYYSDSQQQFYTIWEGKELGFGLFNTTYKEDIQYLVDDYLDTICWLDPDFIGAKLEWFQNGIFRDIRLVYKSRMLKFWIVADSTKVNLDLIKEEAIKILEKLINEI